MSFRSSLRDDSGFSHSADSFSTAPFDIVGEVERRKSHGCMLSKLYYVSLEGDLHLLHKLLQEDPLILDRCFNETQWSPLHMASSKGHTHIVRALLEVKPSMCFARDRDGRTPVHIAAIEGHIDVIELIYQKNCYAVRERTNSEETILHLCVKHNNLSALEKSLELTNDVDLLNSKDKNGNTVLHLAVLGKHVEIVKLLLKQPKIAKNAINNNGFTALDIHATSLSRTKKQSSFNSVNNDDEIWVSLTKSKALRARSVLLKIKDKGWVESQSQALMVVASLIATMAFQVVLSPPRGFWQDGKIFPRQNDDNTTNMNRVEKLFSFHDAGAPIARDSTPRFYHQLMMWNTIALASSLSVILLLISGLAYGRRLVEILRITMWISVTATITTYSVSLIVISWHYSPKHKPAPAPTPATTDANGPNRDTLVSDSEGFSPSVATWITFGVAMLLIVPILIFLVKFIKKKLSSRSRSMEQESMPITN